MRVPKRLLTFLLYVGRRGRDVGERRPCPAARERGWAEEKGIWRAEPWGEAGGSTRAAGGPEAAV